MTAAEFRAIHGDPTSWTSADHESYEHLAAIDAAAARLADVHVLTAGITRSGKSVGPVLGLREVS